MSRKLDAYIEEVLDAIKDIQQFVLKMSFETYERDAKTRAAVERKLLIIGEALNQMCKLNPNVEAKVTDIKKIVAFRNILVHGYFGIDDSLVWDVVNTKLEKLKEELQSL